MSPSLNEQIEQVLHKERALISACILFAAAFVLATIWLFYFLSTQPDPPWPLRPIIVWEVTGIGTVILMLAASFTGERRVDLEIEREKRRKKGG